MSQLNKIGVMQGRLLPKYNGLYQAHPIGFWDGEFAIAKKLGLDFIEFILDFVRARENPLLTADGQQKIQSLAETHGVRVETVCADYFMVSPLHSDNAFERDQSVKMLMSLLESSEFLGIRNIILPCVDNSSISSIRQKNELISVLKSVMTEFEKKDVFLSLETDLPPNKFISLIESINSEKIGINYDTGNSASLGFDPVEEISTYGSLITDVHIKDRILGGGPTMLGYGAAKIEVCLHELIKINYQGPIIMQTYRDDEGLQIFKSQLNYFYDLRDKALAS
jgi:L-ribulose-5-phosphate 3-epimerase